MAKNYEHVMDYSPDWKKKTGELDFPMTSDYLFRALLQKDEKTLKALVATFLKVDPERINEIEITNPIVLGESITDKEYHLDVKVLVDNNLKMNLEMQVLRHEGWIERTLVYACREFDDLNKGDDYTKVLGIWQISFCCFDLFEDDPEFLSDFMLVNIKKPKRVYTDKFRISFLNLKRIDLAAKENASEDLVNWARLFSAKSWEELRMLADNNTIMDQAISSVSKLTEDKRIRDEIWRREDNERIELTNKNAYNRVMEENEKNKQIIINQEKTINGLTSELEKQAAEIERLTDLIKKHNS